MNLAPTLRIRRASGDILQRDVRSSFQVYCVPMHPRKAERGGSISPGLGNSVNLGGCAEQAGKAGKVLKPLVGGAEAMDQQDGVLRIEALSFDHSGRSPME